MREDHDTVIIGGGQAGLAMSAVLREYGREHIVLERRRVGGRWRDERWDSLRFQFPNWSLQLPGYRYAGSDPEGFAPASEICRLMDDYAASTRAPVREHTDVVGLSKDGAGTGFVVSLAAGDLQARRVVVATGPFQRPAIPPLARWISPSVWQITAARYRSPGQLPAGAVLVVGSGASGCQIADELLRSGRRVCLSVSRHRRAPRRLGGKDVYWWLEKMGGLAQTIDSFPAQQWPPSIVITGIDGGYDINVRLLAAAGARVIGRVAGAAGTRLAIAANANEILDEADQAYWQFLSAARQFAATHALDRGEEPAPRPKPGLAALAETESLDLLRENISTIIWATGYTYDFGWIRIPVFDQRGRPVQHRGITRQTGLYFLGLHWMHTIKSSQLSGVGGDAEHLAEHMTRAY